MSIRVFYNEIDSYCCAWLSNLMDAGYIRPGKISDKSIVNLTPDEVAPYDIAHFFAGIAGWDAALTLAGWQFDGRVIWTGSCPCQPFSAAGKGTGGKDDRHLWPHWFRLIRERKPAIVFGENVEAAIGWGWLDAVLGDLEAEGYATGAAVLGAHSIGAPHIRQRLWFVADATGRDQWRYSGDPRGAAIACGDEARPPDGNAAGGASAMDAGLLADAGSAQRRQDAGARQGGERQAGGRDQGPEDVGEHQPTGLLADAADARPQGSAWSGGDGARLVRGVTGAGCWADLVWLPCSDGRVRPAQPGIQPLAHGVPGRVGRLRAYGNAITPQCAAEFIKSWLCECKPVEPRETSNPAEKINMGPPRELRT